MKELDLGNGIKAEVSEYNGRLYASVRKWYQADDGNWYRTKNGLHLRVEDMLEVLAHYDELVQFIYDRQAALTGEERDVTDTG